MRLKDDCASVVAGRLAPAKGAAGGPLLTLPSNSNETIAGIGYDPQTGAFAAAAVELWQVGLLPIPLGGAEGKTPLIRGFTKMRRPVLATIETWVRRWPEAGIGIVTGAASGVLVDDTDSADRAVWKAVEQRFGDTPLKIGTPGGGAHLHYRHSGQKCRNLRPELPVDVKATGGFVVVPPSVRPSGAHASKAYTFLGDSSWDDLARLPPIKPGSLSEHTKTAEIILSSHRTPGAQVVQLGAVDIGYRNCTLFRHALRRAPSCGSEQGLLEVGIEINANFNPPLERSEVAKTISSAWGYEVRGEIGSGYVRPMRAPSSTLISQGIPTQRFSSGY